MAKSKWTKEVALHHWQALPENIDPLPLMRVIPYKTEGSRYGACGVRIDGTPEFIDAVLGRLKSLIAGEGIATRLELSRREVDSKFKPFPNAAHEAEVCYIRLHQRGTEGAYLQAVLAGARA